MDINQELLSLEESLLLQAQNLFTLTNLVSKLADHIGVLNGRVTSLESLAISVPTCNIGSVIEDVKATREAVQRLSATSGQDRYK
jgi:hypothetical protein